ncbi:ester cyclase [Pseudofrankia sp. BMG5.37]|uniref:ester cyclase n=1 Tax=Pseudofrankia sp. BMG5.37 TaxID=3050035 RepID=UPI002893FAEC|nr:ester cyclase [Pseudofrankia sp. BMG5.37]MDT3446828.1 ester cyclase [Pseudofrankia sp. BMG5.37]
MRRFNKLAVVLAALALLTLSACGSGSEDPTGTASGTASSGAPAESGTRRPPTAESNTRIMERFTREFLPTGDAALAEEFISPDIVMYFAGQQQQGRGTYLDIVAANRRAFPDLVWTVEDMVAEGDTVAVRYIMTGTHRGTFAGVAATGRAVHAQSMAFYRLADGKIVEERAQLDMLSLLQQMGAVPNT